MKMAKLGFAAVAALLLFMHCELGQAMALRVRCSLGQGPVRMARGSPADEGMKTMAARAVQTSSDKSAEEDDVFLAPLVHLIGRYMHVASHPCIPSYCGTLRLEVLSPMRQEGRVKMDLRGVTTS
ncbi:hypothetical protein SEVIR_8G143100v4 [Setaria viridis]|uniref:Uncharacterized protein n=1 Tax=Setaria viridis TaxID=4556 RepID=A0A4U6TF82_SETVI|nr:hypothetical protein SEVIR_8G143100v2 [Setaria viridis]